MASQKISEGKNSQPKKSSNEATGPRLEPSPPNSTSPQYDPHSWRGEHTALIGQVVIKGNTNTPRPWVKIFNPTSGHSFFSSGAHTQQLPKHSFVSFKQDRKVYIGNSYEFGASNIKALTRAELLEHNEGGLGTNRSQTWVQGTARSINNGGQRFLPRHAIEFTGGNHNGRPQRISYDASSLLEGSDLLPPGSPVFFQTSLKPQPKAHKNQKGKSNEAEVTSIVYDWSRYSQHAGLLPSQKAIKSIEKTLGKAHMLLGSSSVIDPRAVSILDLIDGDEAPVEGASLNSLIKRGLDVLMERKHSLVERMKSVQSGEGGETGSSLISQIESIKRTLEASSDNKPLHVFAFPNFISRNKLIDQVNRHYRYDTGTDAVTLGQVRIIEMASASLNPHNTYRSTGLIARLTNKWKVDDFQTTHQLFKGAGPFVSLEPVSSLGLADQLAEEVDVYRARNTNHHLTQQLLVISLSPDSPASDEVECSEINLIDTPPLSLDLVLQPSILLVYDHSRRNEANPLTLSLIESLKVSYYERVEYVDARKMALRLFLVGADPEFVEETVRCINNPEAQRLLQASNWDLLHLDQDNEFTRTLLCRSGFNPPHDILIELDPDIQYTPITHGVLRIHSTTPTHKLLQSMSVFNAKHKTLDDSGPRGARGDRATFQALIDGEGTHYVGPPPSPPVTRSEGAWGRALHAGARLEFASSHRIIIKGPAPGWSSASVRTVMESYGITEEAMTEARWATMDSERGTVILVAHDSVMDLHAEAKIFSGYILTESFPIDSTITMHPTRKVLQDAPPQRSPHETTIIMAAAIKSKAVGFYVDDPSQQKLIGLTKSGASKAASTKPAAPPTKPAKAPSGAGKAGSRPSSKKKTAAKKKKAEASRSSQKTVRKSAQEDSWKEVQSDRSTMHAPAPRTPKKHKPISVSTNPFSLSISKHKQPNTNLYDESDTEDQASDSTPEDNN